MKRALKLALAVLVNAGILYLAAKYIDGFVLTGTLTETLILGFLLSLLSFILKPVLKMVLGPIILFTLGLGMIFVYMIILYVLDISSANLSILSILALVKGAVLLGIANIILHFLPL